MLNKLYLTFKQNKVKNILIFSILSLMIISVFSFSVFNKNKENNIETKTVENIEIEKTEPIKDIQTTETREIEKTYSYKNEEIIFQELDKIETNIDIKENLNSSANENINPTLEESKIEEELSLSEKETVKSPENMIALVDIKEEEEEEENISVNEISKEVVEEKITEENSLSPTNILDYKRFDRNHDVMNCDCSYTTEQLASGLQYTIKDYAQYYIDAKEKYGICPLYNSAKDAYESGWGRHCPNYNLGGVKTSRVFTSPEEFIDWWSSFQLENYLTKGGPYYRGTTIAAINKCYNGRESWEITVAQIMTEIHSRIVKNQNA